ncbi:MAG: YeeE/YedE family protein [Planctomycetes bacterium]|nr:YeeE/YedE family protein [Planctomycetota bacterium]
MSIILPLLLGVVFGFALNKAGLTKYHKIVNQFRLNDMAVLKFMLTALVVAMLGLYPLHALGVINFPTVPATYVVGNLVGGLIFGVGMALAGFCPGTCVAGAGEGKVDYLLPGILGFLTGAVIYGLTYDKVFPKISAIANYGNVTLPELWHISPYLAILVFTIMALVLFYLIDRMGMQRKKK